MEGIDVCFVFVLSIEEVIDYFYNKYWEMIVEIDGVVQFNVVFCFSCMELKI